MIKEDYILDIISLLKSNFESSETKACLFLCVDTECETMISDTRGNGVLLSQAFYQQMKRDPNFNRLIKAFFGSYLLQNPEEKEEFLKGLEHVKNIPNMN